MDKRSGRYWVFCIYLVLVLTTITVFWRVCNYGFVNYDDNDYVAQNPQVIAGMTRESVVWAFTTAHSSNWHPLTWLSHMLDCQLFGLDAGWHHLTNLLLHIVNTLLLFYVLKKMTGALWRSAFVAAVFALHPLHVESVAWISERKDVLSSLFWMLTMVAYLGYIKRPNAGRYLLTLFVFALGLMAKPMLVTLPFVLLLLDYWPLGRIQLGMDSNPKSATARWQVVYRLICEKIPFFPLSVISSIVTFLVQQNTGAVVAREAFPLIFRIVNTPIFYLTYIAKMIWPSRLAVFYPHPVDKFSMWQAVLGALLLLGISIWVICLARSRRYLLVGWLWYLGTLVPVIGLVQVGAQGVADRYTYLPLIGIFIMVAWGVGELLAKWRFRRIVLGISAGLVLAVLLICTRMQVRYWQNSAALFEHALKVTSSNYVAHFCLADYLREQGSPDKAVTHFTKALQIRPDYAEAHGNLGYVLAYQGKLGEAIAHLTEALRLKPDWVEPMNNLAWFLATHKETELHNADEAVRLAEQACGLMGYKEPGLLDTLAAAYAAAGRFSEAVATAEKALELAQSPGQSQLEKGIRSRQHLYKSGRPYIELLSKGSSE